MGTIWENKSMEICRENLGSRKFDKLLEKASQVKEGSHPASKQLLTMSCSEAKKLVSCPGSILRRRKAVGAAGYAVVLKNDRIPVNEFFEPGRRFRVRFRHSNIGCDDDAGSCQREAAIKFADQNEDGPMDLVMFTGRTSLARNCHTLLKVLKVKKPDDVREMCHSDPRFYFSLVDGVRRGPTSYSHLSYYSQFAYRFTPKDEHQRAVRFRLIPYGGQGQETESGSLSVAEQKEPWNTSRSASDERTCSYLRNEYIERLHRDEPVKYMLQMQLTSDKTQSTWNPQLLWNESDSPWLDTILIELTTFLPDRTLSRTFFNIVEKPKCLDFPHPISTYDYFSCQKVWSEIYTKFEMKHVSQIAEDSQTSNGVLPQCCLQSGPSIRYYVTVCAAPVKENTVPRVDLYLTLAGTESRTTPLLLEKRVDGKKRRRDSKSQNLEASTSSTSAPPSSKTTLSEGDEWEDMFEIKTENVGDVLALFLAVRHRQLTDDWYLRYIVVAEADGSNVHTFPCHSVVQSDVVLRTGGVCLKQKQKHEVHRQERLLELCIRRHEYAWGPNQSNTQLCHPCGHIKARTVEQLPSVERIRAVKYTGLRWEVDIDLVEFFRTIMFKTTTTGSTSRAVKSSYGRSTVQSTSNWRSVSTIREFAMIRPPSPVHKKEEAAGENRAMNRWKKIKHAIKFISDAKIPDGSKGEMCRSVRSDAEFGHLFLSGPNPFMIRRCRTIPENFPVTQAMVEGLLDRSKRLDVEAKNGRIYLADYAILDKIEAIHRDADHRYMVAPLVLLYVQASGDLVPLAIQLKQEPGDNNPIWTVHDHDENWILAKLWVRCADFQVHFAVSHLLKCHWLMEPFVLASMRQLSSAHPVYKLLKRHFRYTLVNNTLIRTNVMRKGSSLDKFTSIGSKGFKTLASDYLKQFSFNEMFPPRDFEAREVADDRALPNYHYRDDAMRTWNATLTYCRDILALYYNDDTDVVADDEIQAWIRGLHDFGFATFNDAQRNGLPRTFKDLSELAEVVAMVMFTLTFGHSATHTDALDLYGFIPDVPAMMRRPPPKCREKNISRETLATILPEQIPDAYYGSLAFVMMVHVPDVNVMNNNTEVYFIEPDAVAVVSTYGAALQQINTTIRARNIIMGVRYENLMPDCVPVSAEPMPYIHPDVIKKALPLGLNMTKEILFGKKDGSHPTVFNCMMLPIGAQFARTLGGRSCMARRFQTAGAFSAGRLSLFPTDGSDDVDGGAKKSLHRSRFHSLACDEEMEGGGCSKPLRLMRARYSSVAGQGDVIEGDDDVVDDAAGGNVSSEDRLKAMRSRLVSSNI